MRRLFMLTFAAVLAIAVPPQLVAQDAEADEIRALMENVAALMQAGDLAPLDDIYAPGPGVHIIEGAGVNHGWEEYRDHHLKPELEMFENFEIRYFAIEPQVRGEVAYTPFRYELSADTPRGPVEIEGRGTAVLEKLDGHWRIVHTHTSGRPKG
jgi:ketosteroid isomerase-like protein